MLSPLIGKSAKLRPCNVVPGVKVTRLSPIHVMGRRTRLCATRPWRNPTTTRSLTCPALSPSLNYLLNLEALDHTDTTIAVRHHEPLLIGYYHSFRLTLSYICLVFAK
jgi:hypothetical protein